jgi:UDP-N-acetyl-D-mannosaminuronate dehydrogenase
MPEYCIKKLKKVVGNLKNKKIAILGLSYKGNVKEDRFSITYEIIRLLKRNKVKLYLFDPFFTKEEIKNKTGLLPINLEDLKNVDGVITAIDIVF